MGPLPHFRPPLLLLALASLVSACGGPDDTWPPERARLAPAAAPHSAPVEPAAGPARAEAPPIDWNAAADCHGKLQLLLRLAREGRLRGEAKAPVSVLVHEAESARGWLAPAAEWIEADLPLEVRDSWAAPAAPGPCVIEIGPAFGLEAEHRILRKEPVQSAYESGSRSEKNPEYELAQARIRELEQRLDDDEAGDVVSVGDPMLDLVGLLVGGVISGLEWGSERRELDEALKALKATPRSTEKATYRAYHFERTTYQARRAATIPVALVDRSRERTWRTDLRQREARTLYVLDGLDPRDPEYQQHRSQSVSMDELERWTETPPKLQLSSVVAALLHAPPAQEADPATGSAFSGAPYATHERVPVQQAPLPRVRSGRPDPWAGAPGG